MTSAPRSNTRPRSLQDDLLDDLRRVPDRASAAPVAPASVAYSPEPASRVPALASAPTPAVELRITPRSWSSAGWTRRPEGDGLTINLGPVCLSLGRLRP
jgi:hypothetical protein